MPAAASLTSDGTMTVDSSTLSGNYSVGYGGGIYDSGTATVQNSTLTGNSAFGGGGIDNDSTLTVDNSTLSGNSAVDGGGIYDRGTLTVHNSTLSGNSAYDDGGGIYTRGTSTLDNTIVAANFSVDIDGAVTSSSSHNLIGVDTNLSGISNGSNGNQVGTAVAPINPRLGLLQGNGGPTLTMALLPGSPAIDAGDNTLIPAGVTTDQRGTGYARIENGARWTSEHSSFLAVVNHPPFTFTVTNLADNGPGQLTAGDPGRQRQPRRRHHPVCLPRRDRGPLHADLRRTGHYR